jgi:catechol 2,3-dioxygenase-like lactoylglutathione lyase family enzyme
VHAEFTEDVVQVLFDRAFCNAEGIGNLPVAHSLHQQIDDLALPFGERRLRLACRWRDRGCLTPIALPSLPFAAIAYPPVSAFTPLAERPLQTGRRLRVRNCFLSVYQNVPMPHSSHPSKQDTSEFRERFPFMKQSVGYVALVVRDYDEAIRFYVETLGFVLIEDTFVEAQNKRWVLVAPPGSNESRLLLARAVGAEQESRIGNQTGGRVFLFLHTDDFWRDYRRYQERGVVFIREPKEESYGTVAVFLDLYGNQWDLLQLTKK